ncbi:MAG: NADH-quinone oxidoreductase subunit M [Verrucomicrobiae bacterium]|nr:NADH-quinone oxidoreductase subunit M [Verrucomicrobiae bacterium]MCP5539094.1 NADH-quinone oxidoreductase subunit M [Akkermansiaceae bacterium]
MSFPEYIILIPIVFAVAILFGAPARFSAILAAALDAVAGLMMASRFDTDAVAVNTAPSQFATAHEILSHPKLSLSFGIDGISLVLVLLTVLVTLAAVLASPAESKIKGGPRLWYISLLLIAAGALGAFCSTDLFFFYAFHELALIPTFLMIGRFSHNTENRVRTAWTVTIYLAVGSLILLAGLIALFFAAGGQSFAMEHLYEHVTTGDGIPAEKQNGIYLTLLIGFGILVSLFPFHSWAPAAYADAPAPVSMLHSGVLKKFGLYGLIRVATPLLPEGAAHWQHLLLALLLGNILLLGLVTIAQRRFDYLLGYSSVMHMGYVFLGIASGNSIGLQGAVLLMFAHGVSIALLFALTGALRERAGSVLEFETVGGGLARHYPALGLLFGFAVFASVGLPGFANFAAELLVFFGGFKPFAADAAAGMKPLQWATVLALWGVVISAVYMLRAYRRLFKGERSEHAVALHKEAADLTWIERLPALLLLVPLMLTGFVPGLLLRFIAPAVEGFTAFLGK